MEDRIDTRSVGGWTPYFITAKLTNGTVWDLLADFQLLLRQPLNIIEDLTDEDVEELKGNLEYKPPKYDEFVPKELIKKAIIADYMDLEKIAKRVSDWTCGTLAVE